MRLRLVGYSGARPPVPGTTPVPPVDPDPEPDPVPDPGDIPSPLVVVLADGAEFRKADYLALGYNRFDVMCIGAAGGRGGVVHHSYFRRSNQPSGYVIYRAHHWAFGGGGGGGGVHRIKGRLALLPTVCPVVVGQAGADGGFDEQILGITVWNPQGGPDGGDTPPPFVIPPGTDGEASSFGGVICQASGGKAGGTTPGVSSGGGGGIGGIGNRTDAGGGPVGAGSWDGKIGSGGRGGAGGALQDTYGAVNPLTPPILATSGQKGAYSAGEPAVSGPGGAPAPITVTETYYELHEGADTIYTENQGRAFNLLPGAGGGVTAFPLNGDLAQYGSKAGGKPGHGAVVVRLTYAIV